MSSELRRVLAVDERDNVVNALEPLAAGDRIKARDRALGIKTAVPLGHKVALVDIAAGAPVIKYGEPIGLARRTIAAGEHVHVHNVDRLFSDWLVASTGSPAQ